MTIKSYFLKKIQLVASWLLVKSQLAFDNDNIRLLNPKNPSRAVNELAHKKGRFLKGCCILKFKGGNRAITYQISPLMTFDNKVEQVKDWHEVQDTVINLKS